MSRFLDIFYGSGLWNFFHLLWILKVFIHVAPLDAKGGYTVGGGWKGVDTVGAGHY